MRQNLDRSGFSISLENFKKILKSGDFRYVGLHGWGEPLLNPHLFHMVEYAESEGVYTNLTTNGTLIGGYIDKILSSGLREIAFGIYHKDRLSSIYLKNILYPARQLSIVFLLQQRERSRPVVTFLNSIWEMLSKKE